MTRAGRKQAAIQQPAILDDLEHGMRRMIGGRLHGHGLVPGGVERLAGRVDDRESRVFEGLLQQPECRLLALGQGRGISRRRRFERERERVGDRQ